MEKLQKINELSSFLLHQQKDKLSDALKDVHNILKEKLNFPNHMRISGFKLDSHSGENFIDPECEHICHVTYPDGSIGIECCRR